MSAPRQPIEIDQCLQSEQPELTAFRANTGNPFSFGTCGDGGLPGLARAKVRTCRIGARSEKWIWSAVLHRSEQSLDLGPLGCVGGSRASRSRAVAAASAAPAGLGVDQREVESRFVKVGIGGERGASATGWPPAGRPWRPAGCRGWRSRPDCPVRAAGPRSAPARRRRDRCAAQGTWPARDATSADGKPPAAAAWNSGSARAQSPACSARETEPQRAPGRCADRRATIPSSAATSAAPDSSPEVTCAMRAASSRRSFGSDAPAGCVVESANPWL